jgi:hypothetical protein
MGINANIVHSMPRRVRLRVHEKRSDAAFFSSLSEQLSGIDDVTTVKVNPATQSVVIEFSSSLENLLQQLQQKGLDITNEYPLATPQGGFAGMMIRPVNLVSTRNIDAMFMVGTLLAITGIVQIYRGKIAVPAITALWYAFEAYWQSGKSNQQPQ